MGGRPLPYFQAYQWTRNHPYMNVNRANASVALYNIL